MLKIVARIVEIHAVLTPGHPPDDGPGAGLVAPLPPAVRAARMLARVALETAVPPRRRPPALAAWALLRAAGRQVGRRGEPGLPASDRDTTPG